MTYLRLCLVLLPLLFTCSFLPAQWVQTNGPMGGNIPALATTGSAIFVASDSYINRSTDNGDTWVRVRADAVTRMIVHNGILFTGGNGVQRSYDNGDTWLESNTGLTTTNIASLAAAGSSIFAMTTDGPVFRSDNDGLSWMDVGLGGLGISAVIPQGNKFLAAGSGVFRSDTGNTWVRVDTGITSASIRSMIAAGSVLIAGDLHGIYRSTDQGDNWTLTYPRFISDINAIVALGGSIFAAFADSGLLRSSDNGVTWALTNTGLTNRSTYSLVVNGPSLFVGTGGGGVFRSTNVGASWEPSGMITTYVESFASKPNGVGGYVLFAGSQTDGKVYKTTDKGDHWTSVASSFTWGPGGLAVIGDAIYVGPTGRGGLYRSFDDGANWTRIGYQDTIFWTIVTKPSGSGAGKLFAGTYNKGVLVSVDNGSNWSPVNSGLTHKDVRAIVVNDSGVYAATGNGIFRTTDDGVSWSQRGLAGNYFNRLFMVGIDLYASQPSITYRSTDYGASWAEILNNGVSMGMTGLVSVPNGTGGNNLFATTLGKGIVFSTDNGSTWTRTDTAEATLSSHTIFLAGSDLYVGSWGDGVWRRPVVELTTGVAEASEVVPTQFILQQNYPNPFNPTTSIDYGLSAGGYVDLRVFDLLGREVAVLVRGEQLAGSHSVRFDGKGLTSGTYLYRIKAGTTTLTKKLLLLR